MHISGCVYKEDRAQLWCNWIGLDALVLSANTLKVLSVDNKRASQNQAKTSGSRVRNVSTDLQLTFYPVSLSALQDAHIPNVLASFLTSLWGGRRC